MDAAQRKQLQRLYRTDGRRLAGTMEGWAQVIPLPPASERALERPSDREIAVLQLVADGFTNREIGRRLSVTEETVKSHMQHLLAKVDARNRAHAVSVAFRRGLIV